MVIGIKICKDTVNKDEYVGAMVASVNRHCTRWYSRTECNTGVMQNLSTLVQGQVYMFNTSN